IEEAAFARRDELVVGEDVELREAPVLEHGREADAIADRVREALGAATVAADDAIDDSDVHASGAIDHYLTSSPRPYNAEGRPLHVARGRRDPSFRGRFHCFR